jgi:hypothetical protein
MADVSDTPPSLAPDEAVRVTEFARACRAAARAVVLYPDGHPAIAATLGRIVHVTSAAMLPAPMTMMVLPQNPIGPSASWPCCSTVIRSES